MKNKDTASMHEKLNLNIESIPFSRFGSYIAFSKLSSSRASQLGLPEGLWMRCVHGDAAYEVIHFELIENGKPLTSKIFYSSSTLTIMSEKGKAEICLVEPEIVRIRILNTTLRITVKTFRNHGAIREPDGNWIVNMAASFRSYRLVPLIGEFNFDAPWQTKSCKYMVGELISTDGNEAEMAIEEMTWSSHVKSHEVSFNQLQNKVSGEFEKFCKPFLTCENDLLETTISAAYLDWSSVVQPHRLIKRPAMYMSKNWMTNVWAWDHAFNALAVCLTDTDLAWDQLMVIFDHQNENGQIPDFINDVKYLTCFVKPPIHGWVLARMIEFSGELPKERISHAYEKLSLWTNWWFNYRNPDEDGLPVYHHGNDSGWDNGTVFDVDFPIKSADLAAFLIIQMDTLAKLALQIGKTAEAQEWKIRADSTLDALITKLWDGNKFNSISTVTNTPAKVSDTVFNCLPIILGKRLPIDIRNSLVIEIKRHLTDWGLASEHPDSSVYEPNGYWRGPIWAPPTMILVDGLYASSETELALDIAKKFCNLCDKSGFAENFDAQTGAPLRDLGYTWTSSVFLVLANKYI
jgi:putative isomerase